MKKLVLIAAVVLMSGIVFGQRLQKGNFVGFSEPGNPISGNDRAGNVKSRSGSHRFPPTEVSDILVIVCITDGSGAKAG